MSAKAKTQTTLRESRLKWAERLDDLQHMPVGTLRKVASEVGLWRLERGSDSVTVNKARKPELINKISEICKEQKRMSLITEERVEAVENVVNNEAEYVAEIDRNEEMGELIKQTWAKLEKYVDSRWSAEDEYYKLPNSTVISIVSYVSRTVDSWTSKKPPYDQLKPATRMNLKREVSLTIKDKIVPKLKGTFPETKHEECVKTAQHFYDEVKLATADEMREKRQEGKVRAEREETNVTSLRVSRLLTWADDLLTRLDDSFNPRKYWREVAVALLAVTGRRQSEITSSGSFEKIDDTHVLFKGQLKTQRRENIKEDGYIIPVLTSPENIIKAINWLESAGKRNPDHKDAHNLFSKYINEEADEVLASYVEFLNEPENPEERLGRKAHLFRAIYAVTCVAKYQPDNYTQARYAQEILGELYSQTGETYLRKCRVLDAH